MSETHNCEKSAPEGFLTSGHRQDGEEWKCPDCGAPWVHVCDEAEGCFWSRVWDAADVAVSGE